MSEGGRGVTGVYALRRFLMSAQYVGVNLAYKTLTLAWNAPRFQLVGAERAFSPLRNSVHPLTSNQPRPLPLLRSTRRIPGCRGCLHFQGSNPYYTSVFIERTHMMESPPRVTHPVVSPTTQNLNTTP